MKASTIYDTIIQRIEALTPAGGKMSSRDGFRSVPVPNPSQGSRSFAVEIQEYPHPVGPSVRGIGGTTGAEEMAVTFAIGVVYRLDEQARALDDAEGIVSALRQLPDSVPQIINVHPITPLPDRTVLTSGDNSVSRLAAYNVRVVYDGRDT